MKADRHRLGLIDTPRAGGRLAHDARAAGVPWCADNGAFSDRWDETAWWAWLTSPLIHDHAATCLFAVAPDVVGDAAATESRARPWLSRIRDLGYPVAYVAQNGMEHSTWDLWDDIDCLFLGGTWECRWHRARPKATVKGRGVHIRAHCDVPGCGLRCHEWKLSQPAVELAAIASSLGKWVHVGRVNSGKRIRWAAQFADSSDGTFLAKGPDVNLPRVRRWLDAVESDRGQGSLFSLA